MKFHVCPEHVRSEKRKAVFLLVFLSIVSFGFVAKVLTTTKITDLFIPIIGLLAFVPSIFASYKRFKEGKDAYPVIELDEANKKIAVLHKDLKVEVDYSLIKRLRLQRKSGQLVSILVKTSSGEDLRFNGYENLDALGNALARMTPKECITNASFFHR